MERKGLDRGQWSVLLLILGLVFSQFVFLRFYLFNGFEWGGILITAKPLIGFNSYSGANHSSDTSFFGDLFFLAFWVMNYKDGKKVEPTRTDISIIATVVVLLFEFSHMYQDFYGTYDGAKIRVGLLFFLFNFTIYRRIYNR